MSVYMYILCIYTYQFHYNHRFKFAHRILHMPTYMSIYICINRNIFMCMSVCVCTTWIYVHINICS